MAKFGHPTSSLASPWPKARLEQGHRFEPPSCFKEEPVDQVPRSYSLEMELDPTGAAQFILVELKKKSSAPSSLASVHYFDEASKDGAEPFF